MFALAKTFVQRYERRLSAFAFLCGFVWDNFTLTRIDRLFDNIVLTSYLALAFAGIVLINAHGHGKLQSSFGKKFVVLAHFLLPFAFGGLFSGFIIFYSRSGEVLASLPFLLLLGALVVGNELFRRQYERFIFQMSIFFVTLFSYAALIIPVLLGRMGGFVFFMSGIVSLVLFWLALRLISFFAKEEVEQSRYSLYAVAVSIFIAFNFLYFNNMIPPIPLSLTDIGVYHNVERTRSGEYRLSFEKAPWYAAGMETATLFHRTGNTPVYIWSSVFAPTRLDTEVQHRWSYVDADTGEWVSTSVIVFPISGGRDEGYRGYSKKDNVFPGKWRVDVETLRGQIIGRVTFTVEEAAEPPTLKEIIL